MENKNRNSQAHTGQKSSKPVASIESLLPIGEENAISKERLIELTGCGSVRELRRRIAVERKNGAIICSGTKGGYWIPKNREEIEQFCKIMDKRAVQIFDATKSAKHYLKKVQGQQELKEY